jgi:pyruvate dehydrogenase E2 component (dihydrolipoamide acetyltransferase)
MATETAIDVVMPQMGVSVSEGTVTKWLKQEGETVEADEPLLEISTDKVDTEVPSPGSGVVTQIFVQEGETVEVGTKLAQIGGAGGGAQPEAAAPEAPEPAAGEGTSVSTLSVEISSSVSSASIVSPTCFDHFVIVPSDTETPIWGMTTSTAVVLDIST